MKKDSGMVIVEASIVFPVMFLVIFLMIFAGNAYLQKCRVEAIVNRLTMNGAAYCADPMLTSIENNTIPSVDGYDVQPYRYLIGGMNSIEEMVEKQIVKEIRGLSTGLFSDMKPSSEIVTVKFNNGFIYSTFSAEVEYKIFMPIRLLGDSENIALHVSTRTDVPVSDSPEFIRNVNMVEDIMEVTGVTKKIEESTKKITEMIEKAEKWFKKE